MKKISTLLLLLTCATSPLMAGITVNTTAPGTLHGELGNQTLTIDQLTVAGPIDASDFATMWHCAYHGKLVDIDLSSARITDSIIPPYAFFHPDEQLSTDGFTPLPLRSLTLPSGLQEIGQSAFAYTQLTTITLPRELEQIGSEAFTGCTHLTGTITIPDNVTTIPADCFRNCLALDGIQLSPQLHVIEPGAFADCGIRTIDIPDGVRTIGHAAFRRAYRLETVAIPNSCTQIGTEAFSGCRALTYLQLPDHLSVIPDALASHCPKLMTVDLPASLKGIKPGAFRHCPALRSVLLPNTLEYIAIRAFEYTGIDYMVIPEATRGVAQGFISHCTNLKAIYCTSTTPPIAGEEPYNDNDRQNTPISSIRWTPFYDVNNTLPVYVPKGSIDTYRNAWGWNHFTNYRELPEGFDPHDAAAVEQLLLGNDAPRITTEPGQITITTAPSGQEIQYTIHNPDGSTVATGRCTHTVTVPCTPAIYIITAGSTTRKIAVR